MSPRIRLEPLGEEIDCGRSETVLDAAFRQGYSLAHGCREGQCSACKCFLLEGEVDLRRHSNFALSDTERESGYALMCRALPESDLVVELLHFDPDNYRLENAIREVDATVVELVELTHDIVGLTLTVPKDFAWLPGQYVDVHVPGPEGVRRSFSIASLPGQGQLELMIKRYPGGRFSGQLGDGIRAGAALRLTGPYGAFHLRRSEAPILMIAGGSGMAPVLGVLRQLAEEGCTRPVRFFYGARTEADLFMLEEIGDLGARLADFRFTPVTGGFVHEAVDEELTAPDVYMCGPPPMLEACEQMLVGRGIDPGRIFQDRFTTSAEAAVPEPEVGVPASERDFAWFRPAARRATLYEDVTVDTQPSIHRHLTRGWPLHFADGRGTWNDASTSLHSVDWFAFRDPGQQWERPFYESGTAVEHQIDGALETASEQGLLEDLDGSWVDFLRRRLQIPAFLEHGLWFALATAARDALSDSVATCICLQAAMKQRSAQAIVLYAMDLEQRLGGEFPIEPAREAFMTEAAWQPSRRFLERLAATPDWMEVVIAANLCFEPVVATLVRRELGTRAAIAHGDTVTPVLARAETQEWGWIRAWSVSLIRFLLEDQRHGEANRAVVTGWVKDWLGQALECAAALAPVADEVGLDTDSALARTRSYTGALLAEAGLSELCCLVGYEPPVVEAAGAPAPSANPPGVVPHPADPEDGETGFDYVGIVMAKSAEGDAVAAFMAQREGIEVREQPAFWDIRARRRLLIPYEQISEEIGYALDAYSIQHEMSTHYGRMVATDDALMLFSDPTEAMEHLLS